MLPPTIARMVTKWLQLLRRCLKTCWHPLGTCRLINYENGLYTSWWVVNWKTRVIRRLFLMFIHLLKTDIASTLMSECWFTLDGTTLTVRFVNYIKTTIYYQLKSDCISPVDGLSTEKTRVIRRLFWTLIDLLKTDIASTFGCLNVDSLWIEQRWLYVL